MEKEESVPLGKRAVTCPRRRRDLQGPAHHPLQLDSKKSACVAWIDVGEARVNCSQ